MAYKKIVASLEVPPDMPPGLYNSLIMLKGFPDLNFRLLVTVQARTPKKAAAMRVKSASSRKSGKKSGPPSKKKKQSHETE